MATPTAAVGEVVNARRRRPKSQVCCDPRERRTLCRATPEGSAANGMVSQSKVAGGCPQSLRREVLRAPRYNLASFVFGSVRCRGRGPDHGTPKLPLLPRRVERTGARGGECGTCRIDAHAKAWTECSVDSVVETMPGVRGKGRAGGSSWTTGGAGGFGFHCGADFDLFAKITTDWGLCSACVSFAGCCVNFL